MKEATLLATLAIFIGAWVGCAVWAAKTGKSKVVGVGGGFIAGCLAAIAVGSVAALGSSWNDYQAKNPTQTAASPALQETLPAKSKAIDRTLGIRETDIARRFDKALKVAGASLRTQGCKTSKGEVKNTLNCSLSGSPDSDIRLVASINPQDSLVAEVALLMATKNGMGSLDVMATMIATVEALDSADTRSKSGPWITALVQQADKSDQRQASKVVNGREYTVSLPQGLGIWFVVSPSSN